MYIAQSLYEHQTYKDMIIPLTTLRNVRTIQILVLFLMKEGYMLIVPFRRLY